MPWGWGHIWRKEIDVCMRDVGMTEKSSAHYDLFAQQALISGNRVPLLRNRYVDVF
jgi:hypothetical protein